MAGMVGKSLLHYAVRQLLYIILTTGEAADLLFPSTQSPLIAGLSPCSPNPMGLGPDLGPLPRA